MTLPLTGLTAVSLEQAVAAPFAIPQLAALGARISRIAHPDSGDFARYYGPHVRSLSSHFMWTNCSKVSLTLDVKHLQARAEALRSATAI